MKIPGSPIGTSSAGGPSSNSKTMYGDGLHVLTPSNGGGMTGGKGTPDIFLLVFRYFKCYSHLTSIPFFRFIVMVTEKCQVVYVPLASKMADWWIATRTRGM